MNDQAAVLARSRAHLQRADVARELPEIRSEREPVPVECLRCHKLGQGSLDMRAPAVAVEAVAVGVALLQVLDLAQQADLGCLEDLEPRERDLDYFALTKFARTRTGRSRRPAL